MSESLYELIALGARYVFAALMVLIVLRAWRITLIDSRRAAALRRLSPQTGLSGELLVLDGGDKARKGMRYPVIREGMIGSSRRSDIRIRHSSVRRKHAYFQLTQQGLTVEARPGAPLRDGDGHPAKQLTLPDGAEFSLGKVRLLLVLTDATAPESPDGDSEPAFGPDFEPDGEIVDAIPSDPDDLFMDQPVLRKR